MTSPKFLFYFLTGVLFSLAPFSAFASNTIQLNWIGHWKGEDRREELVLEMEKDFEFLHPEVRLNLVFDKDLETPGNIYKRKAANAIVEMIHSGNITWDVVFLDFIVYSYVAETLGDPDWGRKHLVNFGDLPWYRQSQKDSIVSDRYYRDQSGGIFTGPFIEGFITCFWYNSVLIQKLGIKIQEREMPLDTFLEYAKQLHLYNKKHKTSIPLIKLCVWNRLDILFEHLFKSQFTYFEEANLHSSSPRKLGIFLKTLQVFEELAKYPPIINTDWKELGWDQWHLDFMNDDGLFIIAGTYMYSHFISLDPVKFKKLIPIEFPFIKQQNGLVGGYNPTFAVMKKSPHKKLAIALLQMWSKPWVAEKWVEYTKNPTGLKGHLNQPISTNSPTTVYQEFVKDMTEKYVDRPMRYSQAPYYALGPENPISPSEFREKLAAILEGNLKAKAYYTDIMARVEKHNTHYNLSK